ncbi:MAG TPA: SLC13 family permease [Myxococcales bacterium]|nr:SLC13 family permease [Myxococcales bacterium]
MPTQTLVLVFAIAFCAARLLILADIHLWLLKKVLVFSKGNPSRLCLGLMSAVFLLSTVLPNIITVLAFIPLMKTLFERADWEETQRNEAITVMIIAIIYAANIGGLASMVGTPANALFLIYCQQAGLPEAQLLNFTNWLLFGIPVGLVLLLIAWATLITTQKKRLQFSLDQLNYKDMPTNSAHAIHLIWAGAGFCLLIYLSVDNAESHYALIAVWFIVFVGIIGKKHGLTALKGDLPYRGVLWMSAALGIAWILYQLGGDQWLLENISTKLSGHFTPLTALCLLVVTTIFLTELLSNTATTLGMWSVALLLAESSDLNPFPLLLGVAFAGTSAFMSPLATPTSGMAFGAFKGVDFKAMLWSGLVLNILAAIWLTFCVYSWVPWVLGI